MISTRLNTPLPAILADFRSVPLIIGREAATELGVAVLEHLDVSPTESDVRALVGYAARHDESSPARDALVGVLLNASETLPPWLVALAREEIMKADWGPGRESAALNANPQVSAVPRRQALSERLVAERARRIRPRVHAMVTEIIAQGEQAGPIPSCFVARSLLDLRDLLTQRVKNEPVHRSVISRWYLAQSPEVRERFRTIEDALIDVTTSDILYSPERATLEPYLGGEVVAERVRSAVNFRGAPGRARLSKYLARLTPGTPWYDVIHSIAVPAAPLAAG